MAPEKDSLTAIIRRGVTSQEKYNVSPALDPYLLQGFSIANQMLEQFGVIKALTHCAQVSGGYVQLQPEFSYLPALLGNDQEPVFLYQLVEGFEEFLDYDATLEAYPTLSHDQIVDALSFLRKCSQLNSRNLDIDELEDDFVLNNGNDFNDLRRAFKEKENVARVLVNRD